MAAIHAALAKLSEKQYANALGALQIISARSPFMHWAVFAKGLVAFHSNDPKRAAKLFGMLPPHSVPAKAAQLYRAMMAGKVGEGAHAVVAQGLCCILGTPAFGEQLAHSEVAWKAERYAGSIDQVKSILLAPELHRETGMILCQFFFHIQTELTWSQRRVYLDGLFDLTNCDGSDRFRLFKLRCLPQLGRSKSAEDYEEECKTWDEYLKLRAKLIGSDPSFDSYALFALSSYLAGDRANWPSRHYALWRVKWLLERAIGLDPTNEGAYVLLSMICHYRGWKAEYNRLLDDMCAHFPTDKDILITASHNCLSRNAFAKSLHYAERAFQINRLDTNLPSFIVHLVYLAALKQLHRSSPAKVEETLDRAAPFLTEKTGDFTLAQWVWAAKCAAITERMAAEHMVNYRLSAKAAGLYAKAKEMAPFRAAFYLVAHRACYVANETEHESDYKAGFLNELDAGITPAQCHLLLQIAHSWNSEPKTPAIGEDRDLLEAAVVKACAAPCDPVLARQMVGICRECGMLTGEQAITENVLRQDPTNPCFRLLRFKLNDLAFDGSEEAMLKEIQEEARKRNDQLSLLQAAKLATIPFSQLAAFIEQFKTQSSSYYTIHAKIRSIVPPMFSDAVIARVLHIICHGR